MPCFAVRDPVMNGIGEEVTRFLRRHGEPLVDQETNWTQPYGKAIHYGLYNTTGDVFDSSDDHNLLPTNSAGTRRKRLVDPTFRSLGDLLGVFERSLMSCRLLGLAPGSGLRPHRARTVHDGRHRIRFQLPVITNPSAWVMASWQRFDLKRGVGYFFNNGVVHAAGNDGPRARYNLVWDVWLDDRLFAEFLSREPGLDEYAHVLRSLTADERASLADFALVKPEPYSDQREGMVTS